MESLLFIEARVKAGAVEKEKNPAPDRTGSATLINAGVC